MAKKRKSAAKRKAKKSGAKRPHKRNPRKQHAAPKVARKRTRRANPKRRHAASTHHRRRRLAANPPRATHRRRKRHHRRNPGTPGWAMAGLAALAALGSSVVGSAGAAILTKKLDPSLATLERNRYIACGVLAAVGVAVGYFASPVIGAGVAGGAVAAAGTTPLVQLVTNALSPAPAAAPQNVGALYGGGQRQLGIGAVYGSAGHRSSGLGALYSTSGRRALNVG